MKYIIDLSKLQNEADIEEIEYYCERYGTPLPKGHGRLIDANEVSKYVIIGNADLKKCPTIIEADKENEKGVLEQMIAKTQKTLLDSTKAWSNYIDKNGNIY